jgi:hypothetical protein
MALTFCGYGKWEAPYWFIGPEPGMGPGQPTGNAPLVNAWRNTGKCDLCDCLKFQAAIPDLTWHAAHPPLQPTWSKLILLLKTYLNEPSDNDSLRKYQRDRWGRRETGETCVIELSGMAAKSLNEPRDRASFRMERIKHIRQKLLEHKPKFVVMYGLGDQPHYELIAGHPLVRDVPSKRENTVVVLTKHPVAFGGKRSDWIELGEKLRVAP